MIPITAILDKIKIHFIGIGGIGMCGLAEYHLKAGNKVSGSDLIESDTTKRLQKLGAEVKIGHSAGNVDETIDVVVYSAAVKEDNPELKKAKELGLKTMKRAEMLGTIVNDKFLIAVAGTHGKTTTTAMIGKLLADAGLDPLVFVGGNVNLFEGGASRYSGGKYAVVEADEYDRSFLFLKPDISIITSIDEDHLDIYSGLADIKRTFGMFCENSKPGSKIIYCGDDDNIPDSIGNVNRDKFSYGFGNSNYFKITDYNNADNKLHFSIMNSMAVYKDIDLKLIGKHNVLNSAACFAAGRMLNIDFVIYKMSINDFRTVDRRLQMKCDKDIIVFDDYAHHPKEIESSLLGLKEFYKGKKIISVFQPHLYSRTRDLYKEFAKSLGIADEVVLLDIYPAREKPIEGISSRLILKEMKRQNKIVKYFGSWDEALNFLSSFVEKSDVVVFQGAGDITLLCDNFIKVIKKQN
ncbi:MAG: UDP-N-acetylmuramate--L-alanine ligase [Ignavibacteria bacterium]